MGFEKKMMQNPSPLMTTERGSSADDKCPVGDERDLGGKRKNWLQKCASGGILPQKE